MFFGIGFCNILIFPNSYMVDYQYYLQHLTTNITGLTLFSITGYYNVLC